MRELRVVQFVYWSLNKWNSTRSSDFGNHLYDYRPNWTPLCILNSQWSVRYRVTLEAAVCKYREFAVKTKFRNTSFSVRKNPLVKHFRKSQSKFPKDFFFRENRQKVKCCPTSYSRRSKTFEFYHFQSPREERRLKETSSSLAGK